MDDFQLKLLLSFLVGGSYIAFTIWVSEKFGSRLGGLLIGMPSTVLVSLIFIAWTQDVNSAVATVPITPLVTGACAVFVAVFMHFYHQGAAKAFSAAFLAWLLLILPFIHIRLDNIFLSLFLAAVFFLVSITYLSRYPHASLPPMKLSNREFLFRSAFAGAIVALAVIFGKFLGPVWGGVFAAFPAAFSSSLFLLSKKHGMKFTASVARSMPFGSVSNVFFEAGFFFLVPSLGFAPGLALALIASGAVALVAYRVFLK